MVVPALDTSSDVVNPIDSIACGPVEIKLLSIDSILEWLHQSGIILCENSARLLIL